MSDPQGSGSGADPTTEPLLGATPPQTVQTPAATASASTSASASASSWVHDPLYGTSATGSARNLHSASNHIHRSTLSPPAASRPSIYRSLKTLSYVLALALGASSVFAGIWSIFILPLLHSSFAARKAITEQQLVNMTAFGKSLKALRSISIYPPEPEALDCESGEKQSGSLSPIPPATSLSLTSALSGLPTALRVLTDAITATDTTRTSLMTSLSSYTNELHAETLRGVKVGGFGLNSALANEGAAGGRGEEWDKTRKEVRLIKGMLLNRRAFTTS